MGLLRGTDPPPSPRVCFIGKDTGGNSRPQGNSRGLEFHNGCRWAWGGALWVVESFAFQQIFRNTETSLLSFQQISSLFWG